METTAGGSENARSHCDRKPDSEGKESLEREKTIELPRKNFREFERTALGELVASDIDPVRLLLVVGVLLLRLRLGTYLLPEQLL